MTDISERHPGTVHLLKHFTYEHLPAHLHTVSKKFHDLAHELTEIISDGPELTAGLRKLLEAKDCACRAAIDADPGYYTDR